jgi:PAT family beta-lactamase induction signal transducer AmpG
MRGGALARVLGTGRDAFAEFLSRNLALAILALVILYKLCDALAGTMTAPFVLSLGYTKGMYAAIVKGVGLAALLIGGFAGGAVARALPLHKALWIAAFLQMFSNLVFVWLGYQPVSAEALTVAIVVENFAGAIGTVIFVAYLSALCSNPLHTATQYALLTALASTGRTLFSSGTGFAAAFLGWTWFFIGTSLTAVPALLLMVWLERRGHFRALETQRNGR